MTRESTTRFRLEDNPQAKGMVMMILLGALAGQSAILLLASDAGSALYAAFFLPAVSLSFVVFYWRVSRGHIEITDERLELRTLGHQQSVRWPDIVRAELRTISQMNIDDRITATIAGAHQDRRFVEIRLRRPIRDPLWPWQRTDPDAFGPPSTFPWKLIRVYVTDPEGLVEAVAEQLQRTRTS